MRCVAKLQRCGNATHVAIPKRACEWLGWLQGELVVFQLNEDRSVTYSKSGLDRLAPKYTGIVTIETSLPMPQ